MFVLKSTFDNTAKLAKAACISRDFWKSLSADLDKVADKFRNERDSWKARAEAAEGELARRRAHAKSNLRQFRNPATNSAAQVRPLNIT